MCELAVESAGWLSVDPWEATIPVRHSALVFTIVWEMTSLEAHTNLQIGVHSHGISPGSLRTRDQCSFRGYRET
jgi:hypothetical protein